MSTILKIIAWIVGIVIAALGGLWIIGKSQPEPPVDRSDWLTEAEAYEDQTAHTGMDGGAFVVPGLNIRPPKSIAAMDEGYMPNKFALNNGDFETLPSGEQVYKRTADGLLRYDCWVWEEEPVFVDHSGCRAHDIYAFDGFYAGKDGVWDKTVERLPKDLYPQTSVKYYADGDRAASYLIFDVAQNGEWTVARVLAPSTNSEVFKLDHFGRSTYAMDKVDDPENKGHLAIFPDGRTIAVSQAGDTQYYNLVD